MAISLANLIAESKQQQLDAKKAKKEKVVDEKAKTEFAKILPVLAAIQDPDWHAVASITLVVNQICDCCGNTTPYIGGLLQRQKHKRLKLIREIHQIENWQNLPRITQFLDMSVPLCVACTISESQDEIAVSQLSLNF